MLGRKSRKRHILIADRFVLRNLYWRPDRRQWVAKIRDTWTGKVRLKSARAASEPDARNEIVKWLEAVAAEDDAAPEKPAAGFSKAFEEFLELRDVRPITLEGYKWQYKHALKPAFGALEVHQVKLSDVEAFLKTRRVAGDSPRTVSIYLGLLRRFYRWAILHDYADRDPTTGLKLKTSPATGAALAVDQARALVAACGCPPKRKVVGKRRAPFEQRFGNRRALRLAVILSLYTGLRKRNVLGLTWRHVNFAEGRIDFPAEEMKGGRPHAVPIHPVIERELRGELARQTEASGGTADLGAPVLLHGADAISWGLGKGLERALAEAGLGDLAFRWHDLRHTFATWIGEVAPYAVMQALLGHARSTVTDRYLHASMPDCQKAVRSLPDLTAKDQSVQDSQPEEPPRPPRPSDLPP